MRKRGNLSRYSIQIDFEPTKDSHRFLDRSTRFLRSMFESILVSFDPALPVVVFLYASGVQANPDSLLTSSRYRLEWIMIIHGRARPATAGMQRQDPQGALRVGMFAQGELNWLLEQTRLYRDSFPFEIIAATERREKTLSNLFLRLRQSDLEEIQFKN